jgi:hypothetical protein
MRISCWIPKATNTPSEYVILLAFPQYKWLHERVSMLRCMYIAFIIGRPGVQLKLVYTKMELKYIDSSVSGTWYFVKNAVSFICNYIHFDIALLWIMKIELHSRIKDKNAHNVVKYKEISLQMNFTTVKTNIPLFDVRFSSSGLCLLHFESWSKQA